jgi:hypothetical protein
LPVSGLVPGFVSMAKSSPRDIIVNLPSCAWSEQKYAASHSLVSRSEKLCGQRAFRRVRVEIQDCLILEHESRYSIWDVP